jgi:hypothetical protein
MWFVEKSFIGDRVEVSQGRSPMANHEESTSPNRPPDPQTGLPLPDPYPEYVTCPHCGEQEVEVFCYQTEVACHNCGKMIRHTPPATCGIYPFCKRGTPEDKKSTEG